MPLKSLALRKLMMDNAANEIQIVEVSADAND
jgi:hypothetical protein